MDTANPVEFGQFLSTLAPSAVYLIGLVYAIKRITFLYDILLTSKDEAHDTALKILADGHEFRLKAVEASAEECRVDRAILRAEIDRLRERFFDRESNE